MDTTRFASKVRTLTATKVILYAKTIIDRTKIESRRPQFLSTRARNDVKNARAAWHDSGSKPIGIQEFGARRHSATFAQPFGRKDDEPPDRYSPATSEPRHDAKACWWRAIALHTAAGRTHWSVCENDD